MKLPLATIALTMLLSACSPSETPAIEQSKMAHTETAVEATDVETVRKRVLDFIAEMDRQETFISDAYQNGELAIVEKTAKDMLSSPTPGGDMWMQKAFDPYLACDTAWRDLAIYASALNREMARPSATTSKIVADEKSDFLKNKERCKARANMAAEQAIEAERAE